MKLHSRSGGGNLFDIFLTSESEKKSQCNKHRLVVYVINQISAERHFFKDRFLRGPTILNNRWGGGVGLYANTYGI